MRYDYSENILIQKSELGSYPLLYKIYYHLSY